MLGRYWAPSWRRRAAWGPSAAPSRSACRVQPARTCRTPPRARRTAAAPPAARTPGTCPRARANDTRAFRRVRVPPSVANELPSSSGNRGLPKEADYLLRIHRNALERTFGRRGHWGRSCKNTLPAACWNLDIRHCLMTEDGARIIHRGAGTTRSQMELGGHSEGTLADCHRCQRNCLLKSWSSENWNRYIQFCVEVLAYAISLFDFGTRPVERRIN